MGHHKHKESHKSKSGSKKSGVVKKRKPDKTAKKIIEIIRYKRTPRGRPFEKGNKIGNRFKKGEVNNPKGRPVRKTAALACRTYLEDDPRIEYIKRTNAEAIVGALGAKALVGDRGCAELIFAYAEGRPRQSVDINDPRPDALLQLVQGMAHRSNEIGHPEGWMPPEEAEEEEEK
jgi:hypothetical protein